MRVAYIGNFIPAHSTETHYALSFEALGCNVLRLQEDALPDRSIAQDADLLLYTRTWDCLPDPWVDWIAAPPEGMVSAAVHLDVFFGLQRAHEVQEQAMFRAQHVFTADGEHPDDWAALGIEHHWLNAGSIDLSLVGQAGGSSTNPAAWPFDIAFVGSRSYHREWPERPRIIDALADAFGDRFIHVGGDGQTGRRIVEEELNELYRTVPVIAGDSLGAKPHARYWSDRPYETWNRGGFLIFPRIEELMVELGGAYPSYPGGDADALVEECKRFLDQPSQRFYYRERISQRVRSACTYTQRAQTILRTIGLA